MCADYLRIIELCAYIYAELCAYIYAELCACILYIIYAGYGVATIHFFTLEEPYKRDDILRKRRMMLRTTNCAQVI